MPPFDDFIHERYFGLFKSDGKAKEVILDIVRQKLETFNRYLKDQSRELSTLCCHEKDLNLDFWKDFVSDYNINDVIPKIKEEIKKILIYEKN